MVDNPPGFETETADTETLVSFVIPTLRVLYSPPSGVSYKQPTILGTGITTIGRSAVEGRELVFPNDRRISRQHAEIEVRTEHGIWAEVRDLESRNGVRVNSRRIQSQQLVDGDVVRVGNTFFAFRHEPAGLADHPIQSLLGISPAMRNLRQQVVLFGPSDSTILLSGESGTGKEVSARAIHELSGRSGPFIAINCSAIPESLAESQFFGHRQGAFTGAATSQEGFFRAAEGGTLFLDEIGELSPVIQPKLLRALQEREVTPIGETHPIPFDVRIITASSSSLEQEVEEERFRGPLYARLAEITVASRPLRQRREDILHLVAHYIGEAKPKLTPRLVEALLSYDWPFNVRELIKLTNELRIRGAKLTELDLTLVADRLGVSVESVPVSRDRRLNPQDTLVIEAVVASSEEDQQLIPTEQELVELLKQHNGNITRVAEATGRSRRQVYRWLRKADLDPNQFRSE